MRKALQRLARRFLEQSRVRILLTTGYGLSLLSSLLVLGTAVGFLLYAYLRFSSLVQLRIHVEAAWFHAVPSSRPHFHDGPPPHFMFDLEAPANLAAIAPELVRDIASHPFIRARIFDLHGRLLAASRSSDVMPPPRLWVPRHQPAFDGGTFFNVHCERWIAMQIPVMRDGRPVAIVQAASGWRFQQFLLVRVVVSLVAGTLLALLIGLGVASVLSQVFVAPLERIASTARRLAAGQLQARTGLPRGDNEMLAVGESFDEMAEHLQAAFETQQRFVEDASHELKTPLTAIGGMVDLLEIGADSDSRRREVIIETMLAEVGRMNNLVNDLLTLSRAEQHRRADERVDIVPILRELVEQARVLSPRHQFSLHLEPALPTSGDGEALRRVFRNLLDNAVKYTPPGGTVDVRARSERGMVSVEVCDSGIGIGAEDLPHVFKRFYRADRSRARKTGGSGLGLSIVAAIVEGYRGHVSLQSAPGQGTLARVDLLAEKTEEETVTTPATSRPPDVREGGHVGGDPVAGPSKGA